jgi:hypothetical protein
MAPTAPAAGACWLSLLLSLLLTLLLTLLLPAVLLLLG